MQSLFPWRVALYGWGAIAVGAALLAGLASLLYNAWPKYLMFYVGLDAAFSAIMLINVYRYGIKVTMLYVALSTVWIGLIYLVLSRSVGL